mmetsp:Transcript_12825/g.36894  ORF Transcript_12825/g.36894 Transcript_12825/m.36894 type:complete len:205 (+) Transcript_12825:152-766(+)
MRRRPGIARSGAKPWLPAASNDSKRSPRAISARIKDRHGENRARGRFHLLGRTFAGNVDSGANKLAPIDSACTTYVAASRWSQWPPAQNRFMPKELWHTRSLALSTSTITGAMTGMGGGFQRLHKHVILTPVSSSTSKLSLPTAQGKQNVFIKNVTKMFSVWPRFFCTCCASTVRITAPMQQNGEYVRMYDRMQPGQKSMTRAP